MKKVLLISPSYLYHESTPPIGIGYIASALEGIGIKVELIDCHITPDYKKKILSLLPDCPTVGISVNAGTVSSALDIAKAIRTISPQTRIIMGGPQATAVYEKFIPEYADVVVRGEGEDTIVELMQEEDLSKINGIAYWDSGIKLNPDRALIENLDRLRFPVWHLYKLKKYKYAESLVPLALITTSRGCPNDCIYCTKCIHGYKIRFRSIENLLDEIEFLVNRFGVKEISFIDDNLFYYPERIKELFSNIITRNWKNLFFSLLVDPNFGDFEIFKLAAQAKVRVVIFAIESGSQEVLSKLGRKLNFEKLKERIKMARQAGLKVNASFILGFPFDTIDTMQETIDLADNLPITWAYFFIAIPFPGTKFYELVEEKGKFLCDLSTTSIGYNQKAVYEMGLLKAKDVEMMYLRAMRKFYFSPRRTWLLLHPLLRFKSFKTISNAIKRSSRLISK